MNEKKLIEKGYFPKELPPSFHTDKFANQLDDVRTKWSDFVNSSTERMEGESRSNWNARKTNFFSRYSSSQCSEFSISKGKLARRILKIPNPKHFIKVTELVIDKWDDLQDIFTTSEFSTSYPIDEENTDKRAVRTYSKSVQDLRNRIIETSINKYIQVKLDISKFYPTIYTHVISWSLLGKDLAKEYYKKTNEELKSLIDSGDSLAILYKYADELDIAIRACQDKQSVGIPIGPDTSHIVSEIIACRIDKEFANQYSEIDVKACRYYDDFYIFVNTKDEADIVVKGLQKILNQYQLEINDKKVEINEFPISFENDWVTDLHRFEFRKTNLSNSLKHYFSLMWGIGAANHSRTDWIFKYALRTFEFGSTIITKPSWKIFENLLLKTALIQPAVLDIVTSILIKYEAYLDEESTKKIKDLIESVIKQHATINHNFETAWALWLAKRFHIRLESTIASAILEIKDPISILILLCVDKVENLINGEIDYSNIEDMLENNVLFTEHWILAYESIRKGWLTPKDPDLIDNNGFFKILNDLDIDFFDCSINLEIPTVGEITNQSVESENYSNPTPESEDNISEESEEKKEDTIIDVSNLI